MWQNEKRNSQSLTKIDKKGIIKRKERVMTKVDLLIIDPQVDFCDPNGNLAVPGADEDC